MGVDNGYGVLITETMISKKKTLTFISAGFVLQIILALFAYSGLFESCYDNLPCRENLLNWIDTISPYIHLFVPLFIFSLITYWMRQGVYESWFRFARWWIPFSMLAIFLAPEYSSDWMYPIEKASVVFVSSIVFMIASLGIVIVQWVRSRQ